MESSMNQADKPEQLEGDKLQGNVSEAVCCTVAPPQLSILEGREHLQVYLRIRPFTSAESSHGESQDCVSVEPPDSVLLRPPCLSLSSRLSVDKSLPEMGQRFQFSQVFGPDTSQTQLFEGTVKDLVQDVLEGENSLVFTYGITNAGKTFTFLGPDADAGILPRSLDLIFSSIEGRVFTGTSIKPHRCREFSRLSREQQLEEELFKRNLLRQMKESDRLIVNLPIPSHNNALEAQHKIRLEAEPHTRFSVWVSFCEIYNENIHDLLEVAPSAVPRRAVLRLSQDVKGNAFVKDLRWVQVSSSEEAFKVMKLGKRNQSFSSTRLNQLSSRSHSIFSIRILKIEDTGTPRVHTVSELCLCDLAGSERCAKTQNKGERLKEAGNINTSLLILGKCINALRHNQQARLLQHIPFRESKLTHYLQSFFTGRGRACMIVNINPCTSMYDETLNVLRFSAVAQKVVVLSLKTLPSKAQSSSVDPSVMFSSADGKHPCSGGRSSLIGWESSLEDVQEDVYHEDREDQNMMEDTMAQSQDEDKILIHRQTHQKQVVQLRQLQLQLKQEQSEALLMEGRVREEISREFSELFSEMQSDYNERLVRERQILEEREERRLEIFKNLIEKMTEGGAIHNTQDKSLEPRCLVSGQSLAVDNLQGANCHSAGHQESLAQRDELQEALPALQKEKKARLDVLSALQYQTLGKEEALASLEEERRAREDAVATVSELRRDKDELLASLQAERTHKQEVMSALAQAERSREEALAKQTSVREDEARSCLETERTNTSKLEEERETKQQLADALKQKVKVLTSRLETVEHQVRMETERAKQAQAQILQYLQQIQEKDSQIQCLKLEAKELKQQLQTPSCQREQLRDQVSKLKTELSCEREKHQEELQRQPEETFSHLKQQKDEELRKKLQGQEVMSQKKMEELTSKLESEECSYREEAEQLRAKLEEQTDSSGKRVEELEEELQTERAMLQNLVKELKQKETEQETSDPEQLKMKISQQEETIQLLMAQVEELKYSSSCAEELKRLNSDLQAVVTSLRGQLFNLEEKQGPASEARAEPTTLERDKKQEVEETLSAELHRKLQERDVQVAALQKSLQEGLERREEENFQAVQEARQKEAERRRELLAVAHEAIAQKDEELEKRRHEIIKLKEDMKQDSEKVQSLGLQLQRTEDQASDLRDKLADYKKQVQQVQKEISVMREEEKVVRQKLSDCEKSRKQLQSDVANRDRTIQQLRLEQSCDTKSNQTLELYQKSCKELEAKERVVEDMRAALTEQEETQTQMEEVLEEKLHMIQELSDEVEKLSGMLQQQNGGADALRQVITPSHDTDLNQAKQEVVQAQDELKACVDKHQAEKKRWLEDKLYLIGQAKEAEDKRNQEMRKFAEDRERFTRQQSQVEVLLSQVAEKDESMERWRKERDTLVSALEVQLHKLLSSEAEKDKLIQELRCSITQPPPERGIGRSDGGRVDVAELQAALIEKEAETLRLKKLVKASSVTQIVSSESPVTLTGRPQTETVNRKSEGPRDTRASVSSQGSAGFPCVLDASEISTENGRTSRFPRPELEISFSPLQPNRMALRRQGDESAVTVKITRSARKRKSSEMEKEEEAENRRNTKSKVTPKLTPHQEEHSSTASHLDSGGSIRSRKEGTLQKIGDFLQSSPTLLGTKAKKMMSLVSGRLDVDSVASSSSSVSHSSLSFRAKRNKKKLYRPEISSPMDMPLHPIISREAEERESDHQIIRRCLRSRMMK